MGRGLLARFYADGLREHIKGDRFVPRFQFAITAKTMHVAQGSLPLADCGL